MKSEEPFFFFRSGAEPKRNFYSWSETETRTKHAAWGYPTSAEICCAQKLSLVAFIKMKIVMEKMEAHFLRERWSKREASKLSPSPKSSTVSE